MQCLHKKRHHNLYSFIVWLSENNIWFGQGSSLLCNILNIIMEIIFVYAEVYKTGTKYTKRRILHAYRQILGTLGIFLNFGNLVYKKRDIIFLTQKIH